MTKSKQEMPQIKHRFFNRVCLGIQVGLIFVMVI